MARPTKYNKEIIEKTKYYLEHYEDEDDVIPSIAGLAVYLKIRRETLHEWAKDKDKEEFSNTLGEILSKQERVLANKGLKGDFNPTITKLMMANHGYSDKQQQEISGPNGQPLGGMFMVQIVDAED